MLASPSFKIHGAPRLWPQPNTKIIRRSLEKETTGEVQDKPGTSCARKQGSNQRLLVAIERRSQLKGDLTGVKWYNLSIKRLISVMN